MRSADVVVRPHRAHGGKRALLILGIGIGIDEDDRDRLRALFDQQPGGGANVVLPNLLVVNHPLNTERDAEHYVARLTLVGARMDEAIADARRFQLAISTSSCFRPERVSQ